jgi:phosphoribosylformylglycinamidine (FGAM) synthase-like enzyme
VAIAESCITSELAAQIEIPLAENQSTDSQAILKLLFGEGASRILVSVRPGDQLAWEAYLNQHLANNWQLLGRVGDRHDSLTIEIDSNSANSQIAIDLPLDQICQTYNQAIPRRMGAIWAQTN